MAVRQKTDLIVIHSSATSENADIGVKEIRAWHTAKGWSDIGYHLVIRRDGQVEVGRSSELVGAHAKGVNERSFSICVVGGANKRGEPELNFTTLQWDSLAHVCDVQQAAYPGSLIVGHRNVSETATSCPSFDVQSWWASLVREKESVPKDPNGPRITYLMLEIEDRLAELKGILDVG